MGPSLQTLQVRGDVAERLVAPRAILLQALLHDALKFGRDAGRLAVDGLGLCRQNGRECLWKRVAGKRASPGRHLVQHRAEAERVAACVDGLATDLLRRHVGAGAQQRALARVHRRRVRVVVGSDRLERLGEAEVQHLGMSAWRHDDVLRLDVAVDDAALVRLVERIGDLHAEGGDLPRLEAPRRSSDESVSPSTYSITRKSMSSWLPTSKSVQMLGWLSAETARASLANRARRAGSLDRCAGRTLMATTRSRRVSRAR